LKSQPRGPLGKGNRSCVCVVGAMLELCCIALLLEYSHNMSIYIAMIISEHLDIHAWTYTVHANRSAICSPEFQKADSRHCNL
jgi:hypothetical protein